MDLLTTVEDQSVKSMDTLNRDDFFHRKASRAIVLNGNNEVALLYVSRHGYRKLPGGGIDEGEDIAEALECELLEEIGCTAEVVADVGIVIEHRDQQKMVQTSYCFLARQTGNINKPSFTDKELQDGFEIVWAKDINSAIATLENDDPDVYEGKFIQKRDLVLLKAARTSAGMTQ